ncbi:MAG: transposase [Lentisphaerota bacterium]
MRNHRFGAYRHLLGAAILLGTCSLAAAQQSGQAQGMEELTRAMQGLMSGGGSNTAAVVDFRELKALLPLDFAGLKRKSAGGEKSTTMGMTMAYAEASYEGGGAGANIKISDMGGMGSFMMMAQASWAASEIDRESDEGYEKTTTYSGFKALEKYDSGQKSGEVQILVGKRFMVEINSQDVDMENVKKSAEALDLKKLETIKPAAAAK